MVARPAGMAAAAAVVLVGVSGALFSPQWYRVAPLKPRLRRHAQVVRQQYRGARWFLLQDRITGQYHRFSPEAFEVIGRLDGRRSVQQVWEEACDRLGDLMPTQGQVIALLGQLQQADLIQSERMPDVAGMHRRERSAKLRKQWQRAGSPLGFYVPLLDPERFLNATQRFVTPLFSAWGLLAWLALVLGGVALGAVHWRALGANFADQAFTGQNLALLALVYPLIKALHELGHAYAVKRWGGEVHELGVMLMVFYPVPYVDASAAVAFRGRWQRAVVGAAGMMVELALAAVAVAVWVAAEPGPLRAAAANVVMLAGISTLFFNGNPLLRFDAYYILSDLLGIPNLAQRGPQQIGYWLCARVFGAKGMVPVAESRGEARWLVGYAVLAFAYRLTVILAIALLIASQFFLVGVVLAAWSVAVALVWPALKLLRRPMVDARLRPRRARIYGLGGGVVALLLAALFLLPLATRAEGVVWAGDEAVLRARSPGFVAALLAEPGSLVAAGAPLVQLRDPELEERVPVMEAELARAEREYQATLADANQAVAMLETLRFLREQLERAKRMRDELLLRAPQDGALLLANAPDLLGQYLKRGDRLGYVAEPSRLHVAVLVRESDIEAVRDRTRGVELRFAAQPLQPLPASVLRLVPTATHDLPSRVLSLDGGGPFALDPKARGEAQAFERLFRLDLATTELAGRRIEDRAFVLFEHPPEPVAWRWYRHIRRVFLRQFGV